MPFSGGALSQTENPIHVFYSNKLAYTQLLHDLPPNATLLNMALVCALSP